MLRAIPRAFVSCALLVPLACFGDPPQNGGESSESGSEGPSTSASTTTSTSASTGTSASTDPDGSGSGATDSGDDASSGSSDESSTTEAMPCTPSGTWEVVLDEDGDAGNGAQGRGLLGTDAGTVYATGNADNHWLVRRSEDHGASWQIVDDFAPAASNGGAVPGRPARAQDGTMFVIGVVGDGDMNSSRVVRRSSDGQTWETVDDFQLENGYQSNGGSMAIASDGTIVTAGHTDSSQGGFWLVRASEDGGDSWTTIDQYQHDAGIACIPHDVVAASDGAVLVLGHCFDADMQITWVIRRGDGATWTTVDDQSAVGGGFGSYGSANGGFAGARLYAIGSFSGSDAGQGAHWLVRTSDDGITWSTFDDYQSPTGQARGAAIYEDDAGTLIALGSDNDGVPMVVTRRSDDDGASWQVIDEYDYDAGIYGGPLTASADGDLYTSGIGLENGGLNHWVVRRMACE